METRKLGSSGLQVSELAIGTMQFGWTTDQDTAFAIMDAYVEAGGNLIDTANIYSRWAEGNPGGVSEQIIGRWMKARKNRQSIILATKVRGRMWEGPNGEGLGRTHVLRAAQDSLKRLQTDYIDLYQSHWHDPETPIEETTRTMDDLIRSGQVRYLGCSNYPAWRLMEALCTSERNHLAKYTSLQPHYNLVHREEFEREMADLVQAHKIGVINYSPLAAGFLTGKYRRDQSLPSSARATRIQNLHFTERNFDLLDRMEEIGHSHQQGILQVALAWLLSNPLITAPIVGANTVGQLQESLKAVGLRLSQDEMNSLNQLSDWQKNL